MLKTWSGKPQSTMFRSSDARRPGIAPARSRGRSDHARCHRRQTPDVDATARDFARLASDSSWHRFNEAERATVDGFVHRWSIRPGARILEPGCGSGRLTEVLAAQTGPQGRVLAFDPVPAFVRLARARGLPAHVRIRRATVATASFRRGAFDHVVCFNVLPHLVPLPAMLRRLTDALRPGGRFWIAHTRSRRFINAVHRRASPEMHRHLLPAPRMLNRMLRVAGLAEVVIEDTRDFFFAAAIRPPV